MEYISILTPVWNRTKFLELNLYNIIAIDYDKSKLEWCILDDGDEDFINATQIEYIQHLIYPIKLHYVKDNKRRTIGDKRNRLVRMASHKILINYDSDDIYKPDYINYSIKTLKEHKVGLVGCKDMVFLYPYKDFEMAYIDCSEKSLIHEGTMCFTKKYWRSMGGFKNISQGEGQRLVAYNDKQIELTKCDNCMCCVVHNDNTINKDRFYEK